MTLSSDKKYFRSQNHDKNHFLFIPDDSYYNYAGWQSKHYLSSSDDRSLEMRLIVDENAGRIRRELVVNEPKDESVKDQPPSQPQQQQQAPQLNMTNTRPTTHDVKYLSAYSTSEATVQFRTTEVTSTSYPIVQVQSFKDTEDVKMSSPNSTNPKKKVTQPVKADDMVSAMTD